MSVEKSLLVSYPELAKEYNISLNLIDIRSVPAHSKFEVFWTCNKCGYGANGE